ncbi:MAG: TIGR00266 family protein [Alphaproteobacteria bacterium]|nr:TIGR00266 family protein [Alphaproteobacteria bacterium]
MWHCLFDKQEYGPFSTEEAIDFIRKHPNCLVWREGMPAWTPANKFSVLTDGGDSLPPSSFTFQSDLSFRIRGDDMQYVEIDLAPQESVIAEPGALIYKDRDVTLEARLGGKQEGMLGRLVGAGKRVLTGEKAFLSVFSNTSSQKTAKVTFSAPYPGKIIPLPLDDFNGEIICQKDSFLCAQPNIDIGVYFQKKIFTALFGGAGFIMQRLSGSGVVFIHAGGSIAEIDLRDGETIQVDAGCLVAFEPSVYFDIEGTGSLKSQIFGGSGIFFATLSGPGKVWVQSLPFSRLARRFASQAYANRK